MTRKAIIETLRDTPEPVLQMMATDVPIVPQSEDLSAAVTLLQTSSAHFVGVVDAAGRLVGYLTPENLSELLMLRSAREK